MRGVNINYKELKEDFRSKIFLNTFDIMCTISQHPSQINSFMSCFKKLAFQYGHVIQIYQSTRLIIQYIIEIHRFSCAGRPAKNHPIHPKIDVSFTNINFYAKKHAGLLLHLQSAIRTQILYSIRNKNYQVDYL